MSSSSPGSRPTRADAARNRAHILEVAEVCFAEEGLEVSMDAISKRAGVGAGTLYRHFPNREALIAALLEGSHAELRSHMDAIATEETDPGTALARWLDAIGAWMTAYEGLPEPLREAWEQRTSPLAPTCQELVDTTDHFLAAAQQAGQARPSLRGSDLFLCALAIAWAGESSTADETTQDSLQDVLRSGWAVSPPHDR